MFKNKKKYLGEKGAMALSSVLALSIILLALGLAMAFSGFVQSDITYNQDKASIAFYAAEAGARDAIQKVVRNKNYNNTGYTLSLAGSSANIAVTKDFPMAKKTEILSTGIAGVNTKKVRVVLNTDTNNDGNGKVTIESWEECQKSGALCN
jgi:Tfp pilus assembly protein PilX